MTNGTQPTDNSSVYPKTYKGTAKKTNHKAQDGSDIEIVEVLGEHIQVGKSKTGRYCLIVGAGGKEIIIL